MSIGVGNKIKLGITTVHTSLTHITQDIIFISNDNEKSERKLVFVEEYRIKKSKVK